MPTTITCPACGLQGHVPDGFAAPGANCPRCQAYVPLTGGSAPPPSAMYASNPGAAIDAFFAQVAAQANQRGAEPVMVAPPPPVPGGEQIAAAEVAAAPGPPAAGDGLPANPAAEQEWVREEKQRLDGYMARQFAMLRQQREEFSRWRSEVEAALVGREQEVNRQTKLLAGRTETLDQREAALGQQEAGAAQAVDKLLAVEERLSELQELLGRLQLDTDAERFQLQELREMAQTLLKRATDAQADYDRVQVQVQEARAAQEQRQQSLQTRHLEMERRFAALDEAEHAMQRRIAELDHLEITIRRDLDRQRQQLLQAKAPGGQRSQSAPATENTQPQLDQARRELDRLQQALKRAEGWEERERRYRQAVHERNQQLEKLKLDLAQRPGASLAPDAVRQQLAALEQEKAKLREALEARDGFWQQQLAHAVKQREERFKQEFANLKQQLDRERAEKEAVQRRPTAPQSAPAKKPG
ncbi:hypothetical protein AYO44_14785 [Planctomycetaceae bacterium SCGC AG-212-F19]|nr:hypothetical protein AYO44_14785 [Planctomycetaceae bacterium SCGC AG-212-F19]